MQGHAHMLCRACTPRARHTATDPARRAGQTPSTCTGIRSAFCARVRPTASAPSGGSTMRPAQARPGAPCDRRRAAVEGSVCALVEGRRCPVLCPWAVQCVERAASECSQLAAAPLRRHRSILRSRSTRCGLLGCDVCGARAHEPSTGIGVSVWAHFLTGPHHEHMPLLTSAHVAFLQFWAASLSKSCALRQSMSPYMSCNECVSCARAATLRASACLAARESLLSVERDHGTDNRVPRARRFVLH